MIDHNETMSRTRATRRIALLQHGGLLGRNGKTGISLLRYSHAKVVAVIDEQCAGRSVGEFIQLPPDRDVPIVASVQEALRYDPQAIAIGIAPYGGALPPQWVSELRTAARSGIALWNGLHTELAADPVIAECIRDSVYVWDMRKEPKGVQNGRGQARQLACKRVLFVGTDMAIGKMTAALECDARARERGFRSKFIATGQAGMMIAGDGLCLDAVRVDFASGAVEGEVMRHGIRNEVLWIEGQGSLLHPGSTATLPLIRGAQPTHLVLVHRAGMGHLQDFENIEVPSLEKVVELYETVTAAAGAFFDARIHGVALNTFGLTDEAARKHIDNVTNAIKLPCTDTVRFGADPIVSAVMGSHAPVNCTMVSAGDGRI